MSPRILGIVYFESIDLLRFQSVSISIISESILFNICHACRNSNLFERCAVIKCHQAYRCHTIRYSNTCQLGAVAECIVTNFCNLLTVNFIRDFICCTVSCISVYFQRSVIKLIGNKTSFIGETVLSSIQMSPRILGIVYFESIDLLCFRAISIIVKSESFRADRCYTCGNCNLFERCAVIECFPAYRCHTCGNCNLFERCAVIESFLFYRSHACRNYNRFKRCAVI